MIIKKNWMRHSKRIKKEINDEIILRYEVGMLLVILAFSVTIAWFTINSEASVSDVVLNAGELKTYLVVSNTADGVDMGEQERVSLDFKNAHQTKLMPGSEGSLTIFVSSVSEKVTGCTIYLDELVPTFSESNLSKEEKDELQSIITDHIRFYYPDDSVNDTKYIYRITKDSGYRVPLAPGENKKVTLYWIWPYSYADIPLIQDTDDSDKNKDYDLEDSKIGGYIQNIGFKFRFESILKETI